MDEHEWRGKMNAVYRGYANTHASVNSISYGMAAMAIAIVEASKNIHDAVFEACITIREISKKGE